MFSAILKHGTLLTVVVLILAVLGILAALRIPVQMIPDLEVRTISVQTRWPGATPQDVEKEILLEQEEYLRTVPGLSRMVSSASTGSAEIDLEFPFGVDIQATLIEVSNALSQVPEYPENVDEPRLSSSSFSQNAFMYFRITPLPDNPLAVDLDLMRDFVDDNVRTRMERVPGVSQVSVGGGAERQIQILVDPAQLAERRITLAELRAAVRDRNRDVSAGDVDSGKRRYLLRTVGRFEDIEDLQNLIIAERAGHGIRLRDLAEVRADHAEIRQLSFADGQPGLSLSVRRETGSNVIDIKRSLLPVIDELNEDLLEPVGLRMFLTSDDVRYVEDSVANVWQNLGIGAVLATLVLFAFLRSLPATLIGVIGIPLCAIAAFIGLQLAGRTINVISLAGVAFALGMTLDNSIVVLENIERYRRQGLDRLQSALVGVQEVWPAVFASTLTTVLVFAPVLFIEQEAGQLYSDVAIAISAAILASMAVAISVVPSAAARLRLQPQRADLRDDHSPGEQQRQWLLRRIAALIESGPRRKTVIVASLALTLGAAAVLTPPAEYLPEGEEAKTFASMIAPPGYSLTEMARIAEEVQASLLPYLDDEPEDFDAGRADVPAIRNLNIGVSPGSLRIISETKDPAHIDALMRAIEERYRAYPGMRAFAARGSIISSNDGGTRSVNLDIAGDDLATLYAVAETAYRRAEALFDNPRIGSSPSSLVLGQPLIELRPRWQRASELGFSTAELGYAIGALSDGAFVDEFLLANDKIDIYLYSRAGSAQDLSALPNLPIYAPIGSVVPLSAVVDLVETVDTENLRRVNGRRTVTLNIIPPRSVALETAVQRVRQDLVAAMRSAGEIPAEVSLDISGASDQLDATREALSANFVVAVALCYLLLVAVFVHWGYPLLILTAVPLGICGGIIGLSLLNLFVRQPLDMITMLGFLILVGTVVNNPVLIVDQALRNLRQAGCTPLDAVKEAVSARLRPMLMSTLTTLFGLAPLVFIPGAGTELYRGVGAIVLFGLLFALLVTLTFLPALLVTVLEWRQRWRVASSEVPPSRE
ncbi:efflux RND transporter permease subunit [Pseudomarimonas arenosa]|uniref:Efflux RND transporter permease subunit n=1 Tax=Pseudomarimonas arenosa TaxID=2774145 RepID=A0AAW3ZQ39_9GAMM|nr:efflux RND transporter permease subunit [Pseudomarimonas arenosa]MBD8526717.1 efflux RND transporter permease subunit [Pseudomarimonas arenosa]